MAGSLSAGCEVKKYIRMKREAGKNWARVDSEVQQDAGDKRIHIVLEIQVLQIMPNTSSESLLPHIFLSLINPVLKSYPIMVQGNRITSPKPVFLYFLEERKTPMVYYRHT